MWTDIEVVAVFLRGELAASLNEVAELRLASLEFS